MLVEVFIGSQGTKHMWEWHPNLRIAEASQKRKKKPKNKKMGWTGSCDLPFKICHILMQYTKCDLQNCKQIQLVAHSQNPIWKYSRVKMKLMDLTN